MTGRPQQAVHRGRRGGERLAVVAQHARARSRQRRIEADQRHFEGPSTCSIRSTSSCRPVNSTPRRSPPRCDRRSRRTTLSGSQLGRGSGRPLDEHDRIGREVVVEQRRVLPFERVEAEQVEMRDGHPAGVAATDRERGARHRLAHAEALAGRAHERRLSRSDVALDEHDITGSQAIRNCPGGALGAARRIRSRTRPLGERTAPHSTAGSARALEEPELLLVRAARSGTDQLGGRRHRLRGPAEGSARESGGGVGSGTGGGTGRSSCEASGSCSSSNAGSRWKSSRAARAQPACGALRRDGRSGRGTPPCPPSSCTCGVPCTRLMPSWRPGEQLGGEVSERADDARLDQLDLLHQVALAGVDLERLGIAVAGRPALEHVGDEALLAAQTDVLEQAVEQLAGTAHERLALLVLVEARRLADEHQVGVGISGTEHDLGARAGKRALLAVAQLAPEADQLLSPGGSVVHSVRMLGSPTDGNSGSTELPQRPGIICCVRPNHPVWYLEMRELERHEVDRST